MARTASAGQNLAYSAVELGEVAGNGGLPLFVALPAVGRMDSGWGRSRGAVREGACRFVGGLIRRNGDESRGRIGLGGALEGEKEVGEDGAGDGVPNAGHGAQHGGFGHLREVSGGEHGGESGVLHSDFNG